MARGNFTISETATKFSTRRRELSTVLTDFAEIDYSDAASCQNLDAVEPLLELAMAQAWNEFRDPSIVNSGGSKDYLEKSGPLTAAEGRCATQFLPFPEQTE